MVNVSVRILCYLILLRTPVLSLCQVLRYPEVLGWVLGEFFWSGLQHPLHPPKNDQFCYDEKPSATQVKTLQMNLGREQGCLDARAAAAFAGRKVLKKKKNAALFSLFNEEAEAERLLGGWEGKHKSGKSFEQFGPATEMYLTVRYETPAFLPPRPPFSINSWSPG